MTITQSLVLALLIALWTTNTGVDLASNIVILMILLIALVALSQSDNNTDNCYCGQTTRSLVTTTTTPLTTTPVTTLFA